MRVEQRVQVRILGAPRLYSYAWWFDPVAGDQPLAVGDKVELPPKQVQEEGSSGTVEALGSSYQGELKEIVRVIRRGGQTDEDLWGGFGEGDYA
jgi:hypothetical protein